MKKYFPALISLLLYPIASITQELQYAKYGIFPVGFRSAQVTDFSRPSYEAGLYGRRLQINIWYPARNKSGTPMSFSSYINPGARTNNATYSKERPAALTAFLHELSKGGADTVSWRTFFNKSIPTKARMNASFLNGDYPVILLMHGSAADYAFMGELLASHGMVVANVPYKGYLQSRFDVNVIGMETKIRDHEYALDYVLKTLGFNLKKLGLVGTSFGGQSAVGLAVRNKKVKAVVSLDGGIGSTFGPQLLAGFPFIISKK